MQFVHAICLRPIFFLSEHITHSYHGISSHPLIRPPTHPCHPSTHPRTSVTPRAHQNTYWGNVHWRRAHFAHRYLVERLTDVGLYRAELHLADLPPYQVWWGLPPGLPLGSPAGTRAAHRNICVTQKISARKISARTKICKLKISALAKICVEIIYSHFSKYFSITSVWFPTQPPNH